MKLEKIIKGSLLSEKSYGLIDKNFFVLKVDLKSSKDDIKKAVESLFNVKVKTVNTSILRGKVVRRARKKTAPGSIDIKKTNIKKAYIRLEKNEKMPISFTVAHVNESGKSA